MTAVAVVDSNPGQRLVRNVVCARAVCWRIGSTVTGRTLVGNQRLGVIPTGRLPPCNAMATAAIGVDWNVNSVFSCGICTVMTTGAIGRPRERTVIRFGTRPVDSGLVAAVTGRLGWQMSRRLASCDGSGMAACTRPRNNSCMTEFGTAERLCRMACFTPKLSRQVLLRLHHIVPCQTQTAGVTTCTVARRALQYTASVARLATNGSVRASQGEPRLQMIEIRALDLRLQANSKSQEKEAHKKLDYLHFQALDVKPHALRVHANHAKW